MRNFALIVFVSAAAGCTPPMEVTQPKVTAGIVSTVDRQRLSSYTDMTVRAYNARGEKPAELRGVPCTVRSEQISVDVTTPVTIALPRFVQSGRFDQRGRPAQLLVSCEANGMRGAASVDAEDKQVSTATNAGLAGAILTTAVTAAMAGTTPWKFPAAVNVNMR